MNLQNLKRLMEEKGISSYRLAKLSGVNESMLSRILRKQVKNPGILTVMAIARALEVDINCIIDTEAL